MGYPRSARPQHRGAPSKAEPLAGTHNWDYNCGCGSGAALRTNSFRVFDRADRLRHVVLILAIGVKVGDKLCAGGEEIEL